MKKRNQLVGALLAGMLLGGSLTGTTIWADTQTDPAAAESQQQAAEDDSTGGKSDGAESSGNAGSQTEESDHGSASGSDTSGDQSEEHSTPSTDQGGNSGQSSDQGGSSENPSDQGGSSKNPSDQGGDSDKPSDQSGDSGKKDDGKQPQPADPSSEEEKAREEAEAKAKAEAEAKAKAEAEAKAKADAEAKAQAEKAAASQAESSRSNAKQSGHRAESSESGRSGRHSGETSSVRQALSGTTSAGSFTLTEDQKIENMRIGFQQVAKKYGIVNVGANRYLRIRDNKSTSANVVGTVNDGGLVYILVDDDTDWYYVESGKVRGFVMKQWLTVGSDADKIVEEKGENSLPRAATTVSPTVNSAYRYSLYTTDTVYTTLTSANRQDLVNYALSFVGGRYVWGGEDPHTGADCSGFVKYVYEHFGYTGLPRVSYEQCYAGTRIAASEAKPGDLLFYARDGVVYHVLIYIGNGKAVNAQSTATGIVVSDVNYDRVCWGVRLISDDYTSTQASSLLADGQKATNGDVAAQQKIIQALASAAQKASDEYGFPKSVMIAQAIQESGWLSFSGAADGGIQPEDNNILGMNASLLNDQWTSPWDGKAVDRNVPQSVNGQTVMGTESMRAYKDIESCLEDYAAFKIGIHPDLRGSKDIDKVISEGLAGYATDPNYQTTIKNLISKYNLTQYDTANGYAVDTTSYSADQLDLIDAVVAQEDDTSYDGALAVISTVMNRADQNYGGYGTTALSQLTADGQFAYSPKVSDPALYRRRLNGNVPDFVKQAVSDCLTRGIRNHNFLSFRSTNSNGISTQIGSNWYFN